MRTLNFTLLSVVFMMSVFVGYAADEIQLRFRHLTLSDGLASNSIKAINQDHMGVIWVGTDRGLWRYDGIQFSSPLGNDITAGITFLYDAGNELLVGSETGLYQYNYQTDSLSRCQWGAGLAKQTITSPVSWIGEDKSHNLWISTTEQGVFCRPQGTQLLDQFLFPDGVASVSCLLVDNENQIWALSNSAHAQGLARFNKGNNRFELFKLKDKDGQYLPTSGEVLFEDVRNRLWIGTWEDGLISFDPHSRIATQVLNDEEKPVQHIRFIFQYDTNRLLIGSNEGLYMYNVSNREGRLYTSDPADPESLSNRFEEGGLWVGTQFGGLNYVHPRVGAFSIYSSNATDNSAHGQVMSSLYEDQDGRIWMGSNDGGLSVYDPTTGTFDYLHLEGNDRQPHNIHALPARDEEIWVGTYGDGIDVFNRRTKAVRHYPELIDELDNTMGSLCNAIFCDKDNRIWIGTDEGLCLYSDTSHRFSLVRSFGERVNKIIQDKNNCFWIATHGSGIWRYNPVTSVWKQYADKENENARNLVFDLYIDLQGTLWAGTMDGLLRYYPEEEFFEREELPFDKVPDIESIVSEGATLWLGSSFGLIHYAPNGFVDDPSKTVRTYTRGDGLSCRNFMPAAALLGGDGRLYFGTSNGVNAFYSHQLRPNKIVPNVFFTKLEVYNGSVLVNRPEFRKNLNLDHLLELNYDENEVIISFAATSYCQPNKNHYAYWLEGFDKGNAWIDVGNGHNAVYTNLRPGEYVLHVKASNNDKVWDNKEALLKIVVHSPFYWNTYSIIFYVLVVFFILMMLNRYQRKHNELKHQVQINKIQQENDQKIQDAKIRFFTIIAHEIRTPVSLIIAPLQKILKHPQNLPMSTRADLNVINSNSQRLLVLVNQLLDFRKIENGSIYYHFRPTLLKPLLESVVSQFESTFKETKIQFDVTYPDEDFSACIDREAMTKLISNLLNNAQKYADRHIVLKCAQLEDRFLLSVHNDGVSISQSEQSKIFLPFFQAEETKPGTGLGLSIVKGIVNAFHGEIKVESSADEGTTFSVSIPSNLPPSEDQEVVLSSEDTQSSREESPSPAEPIVQSVGEESSPTLLIVDDNVEMLTFLRESLKEDYQIMTAENGRQALKILEQHVVSFIVSDWMMPEMDGEEFCRAVRKNPLTSHIPFIMLTARTDDESKVKGLDCGADSFIEKPFSLDYLQASIRNLLKMRRKLIENFQTQPLESVEKLSDIPTDQNFLNRLETIIEKNYANADLSIDFLCREFGMSRSSFFNKIRVLVDVSPNQMIQLVRLKHAARLLHEGRYSIGEVCYMVGFSNSSYFAKCFQKQFGMTPSEFIEHQKES